METVQDIDFREVQKENPVLAQFNFPMAKIAEMRDKAKALTIASKEDKRGYNAVKDFRLDVRDHRIAVEKRHKEGKAEALEIGRNWDKAKNLLLAELEPIEAELQAKQDKVDQEIQAEKDARQAEINARVKSRMDALLAVDAAAVAAELSHLLPGMSETDFKAHLEVHTVKFNEKQAEAQKQAARLAELEAQEAQRRAQEDAERQRVAKEQQERQAALDAQERVQREAQAKIDADRKALEDAKLEKERQAAHAEEIRKATEKAAEEARLKVLAEAAEKAQAEIERREADRIEAERKLEQAGDKDKLLVYLYEIMAIKIPEVKADYAKKVLTKFTTKIVEFNFDVDELK